MILIKAKIYPFSRSKAIQVCTFEVTQTKSLMLKLMFEVQFRKSNKDYHLKSACISRQFQNVYLQKTVRNFSEFMFKHKFQHGRMKREQLSLRLGLADIEYAVALVLEK